MENMFSGFPCTPTDSLEENLKKFLSHHSAPQANTLTRPVVVVTSGGTVVPLERRVVRFIDNFSAGTRGALSTEEFLKAGYAVIFLHRRQSILPFTSELPPGSSLELLQKVLDEPVSSQEQTQKQQPLQVRQEQQQGICALLETLNRIQTAGTLLSIGFETIFEYLKYLEKIAQMLRPYGNQVLFYLAAAVSDFYIPWTDMDEHKIQSKIGPLELHLQRVPKMLGVLTEQWAPQAMVISFKLETDQSILIDKARSALDSYSVHAVIANILHTRKDVVYIVRPGFEGHLEVETIQRQSLPRIEEILVPRVVQLHQSFRDDTRTKS